MINKKCLIVGGAGFLGIHITKCLLANNIPTKIFDRNCMGIRKKLHNIDDLEIATGDVYNKKELDDTLEGITDIVYLAHTTVPSTSMGDMLFDLESNILPLVSLLQLLPEKNTIKSFVYFSSGGTVYGNTLSDQPIRENLPLYPVSSYGLTKLIAEHYIRLCLSKSKICSYIMRPSNAYGEWQNLKKPQGVVGHFLKAILNDKPIVLYGDGKIVRDYIYAGDIAEAVRLCIVDEKSASGGINFFNVGSGRPVTLLELMEAIQNITGRTFKVNRLPKRDFDCNYNVLDSSAIKTNLGWSPIMKLEDGIKKTWNIAQKDLIDD